MTFFKDLPSLSRLFRFAENVLYKWIFQELNSWRLNPSIKVGRKHGRFVFTTSIKRPVREFHVVVVQWRQRNVLKSLLHVQSCFSLIKTTFFAVLVAVNVIVAYFESSLILTVDGKCEARASLGQWWGEEEKPFLSRATENVALQPQNCFLCCHSTLNELIVTYSLCL